MQWTENTKQGTKIHLTNQVTKELSEALAVEKT